jgi:precorrin-8X/cobalt-precorrin-8 methylmutase
MEFKLQEPPINIGADISVKSFEIIEKELLDYPKAKEFSQSELAVIARLIHTTTCFEQVLDNIYFSPNALERIKDLLQKEAKIIVDVNMIKVGLSQFYLDKYKNEVICYVNEPFSYEYAKVNKTTRSYAAVVKAIEMHKDSPMVLVCGNAPTFIYAAINTLIKQKVDLSNVALLLFPVGFVNVIESKEYGKKFSQAFDVPSVIMQGRFGSSTMGVATLHATYKLIKDYDGTTCYNGK